jgi:hypothetical protein
VRPNAAEVCGLSGDPHDIIDGLASELCLPLGNEQPRQIVLTGGEVALEGEMAMTACVWELTACRLGRPRRSDQLLH